MLKSSYGLSLHTLRWPLVFVGLMFLTSCSNLSPLSLLTGGGPNVAAAVPIAVGETVDQNLGISVKREAPSVRIEPNSKVDTIDQSTINNTTIDPLILLLLILGWLLPSPNEMGRWVRRLFTRK